MNERIHAFCIVCGVTFLRAFGQLELRQCPSCRLSGFLRGNSHAGAEDHLGQSEEAALRASQLTAADLNWLIMRAHPDRNPGDDQAAEITEKLITQRKDRAT